MAASPPHRPRKKRVQHEEHENHERWLVSYADFITLLFAFFVVMYSVSRVDNRRLQQASNAIKWALHFKGTGGVGAPPIFDGPPSEGGCAADTGVRPPKPSAHGNPEADALRRKLEKRLHALLLPRDSSSAVVVELDPQHLAIRLSAGKFFDAGQAVLRPQALPVLDAVADDLAPLRLPLRVEGHTDSAPVAGSRYRDNWDLSAARAATVASYLEAAHDIPGRLLTASGLGDTRPIASDATRAGREANRRIELVVELAPPVPDR